MILAFVGVETTGTNEYSHTPWSIAVKLVDSNGEVLRNSKTQEEVSDTPTLFLEFRPDPLKDISPAALQVSGIDYKYTQDLTLSSLEAYSIFWEFLDTFLDRFDPNQKARLVAYNASFDYKMIKSWMYNSQKQLNDGGPQMGNFFLKHPVCLLEKVRWILRDIPMKTLKLQYICELFEIVKGSYDWHTANADNEAAYALYETIEMLGDKQLNARARINLGI